MIYIFPLLFLIGNISPKEDISLCEGVISEKKNETTFIFIENAPEYGIRKEVVLAGEALWFNPLEECYPIPLDIPVRVWIKKETLKNAAYSIIKIQLLNLVERHRMLFDPITRSEVIDGYLAIPLIKNRFALIESDIIAERLYKDYSFDKNYLSYSDFLFDLFYHPEIINVSGYDDIIKPTYKKNRHLHRIAEKDFALFMSKYLVERGKNWGIKPKYKVYARQIAEICFNYGYYIYINSESCNSDCYVISSSPTITPPLPEEWM